MKDMLRKPEVALIGTALILGIGATVCGVEASHVSGLARPANEAQVPAEYARTTIAHWIDLSLRNHALNGEGADGTLYAQPDFANQLTSEGLSIWFFNGVAPQNLELMCRGTDLQETFDIGTPDQSTVVRRGDPLCADERVTYTDNFDRAF